MATVGKLSMGKAVGTVKALAGSATATDVNGVVRTLQTGDKVYANEIIQTAVAGGTIHIEFEGGNFATLASGQNLVLDNTAFQPGEVQAAPENVEALQAQIAEGYDPTKTAEASAAGPGGGSSEIDGEGSHQFIVIEQKAARGEVTPGFETGGARGAGAFAVPHMGGGGGGGEGPGETGAGPGIPPTEPGAPEPPPGEFITYNARGVMYSQESGGVDNIALTGLRAEENRYQWKNDEVAQYFDIVRESDGTLIVTLNAEGREALEAGELNPYNYLEVVSEDGQTYVIQIIVNQDNSFSSTAENADKSHGGELAQDGLIHGEWHSGIDFTNDGEINPTSNLGDYITFSGDVTGAVIHTGGGEDVITVGGMVTDTSISAGEGKNIVTVGGMQATEGKENIIYSEGGVITVNRDASLGALASDAISMYSELGGANVISTAGQVEIKSAAETGSAFGIYAYEGTATISGGNVNIEATSRKDGAYGLVGVFAGNNTITAPGDVTVTAIGFSGANALITTEGKNIITAGGIVTIYAGTFDVSGRTWGNAIRAYGTGGNEITAGEVRITISGAGSAPSSGHDALSAYEGGVNVISAGKVDILAESGGTVRALYAEDGGRNIIREANVVNIAAVGAEKLVAGLQATGAGSQNVIGAAGNVDIKATGAGAVYGLFAKAGGENIVSSIAGQVTIAPSSTNGTVYGLYAMNGTNTVQSVDINITAKAGGIGDTYGLYSEAGGKNIIAATGQADIKAVAEAGATFGFYADKGTNTISGGKVNIEVVSTKSGAYGLGGFSGTNTIISTGDVNVSAIGFSGANALITSEGKNIITAGGIVTIYAGTTDASARTWGNAIRAYGTGGNEITAGEVRITISGAGSAPSSGHDAISAYEGGVNVISAGKADILAESGGTVRALYAEGGSKNIIREANVVNIAAVGAEKLVGGLYATGAGSQNVIGAAGNVDIKTIGTGTVYGLLATSGAGNIVTSIAGQVTIASSSSSGSVFGLYAVSGMNTVQGANIAITSSGGTAYGAYAEGAGAKNIISGTGGVSIASTASNISYGVRALNKGATEITAAEGKAEITAKGTGATYGVSAETGGANVIGARDIAVGATSTGGIAYGVFASGAGSINKITAEGIDISATSTGGTAYGLYVSGAGSANVLTAENVVNIAATGQGTGIGMYAMGGVNTVTVGGSAEMTAESKGMSAASGGINTIQASGTSTGIEVYVTVKAGYAMEATGAGGINQIIGSEGADFISITGDIIATGGGMNIIKTVAGDDIIVLNGKAVNPTSLKIEAGEGYDTLVLKAANIAEFNDRYGTWLKGLYDASAIGAMSIESVIVVIEGQSYNGALPPELEWLNTYFGDTVTVVDHYAHTPTEAGGESALMAAAFMVPEEDHAAASAYAEGEEQQVIPPVSLEAGEETTENVIVPEATHPPGGEIGVEHAFINELIPGEPGQLQGEEHHELIVANEVKLPEGISYETFVDTDGRINLDVIQELKGALGGEGAHELHGHAGESDILFAGAGHDVLVGGSGDDILVSGTGPTTFVYEQGDLDGTIKGDTILDFKLGEDLLDIHELLTGSGAESDNLFSAGFLNFEKITHNDDGSTTLTVTIDTDGSAGGAPPMPLAELTVYGLNLSHDAGANEVLEQLMTHGSIQI